MAGARWRTWPAVERRFLAQVAFSARSSGWPQSGDAHPQRGQVMKRVLSGLLMVVAAATLSGCYYDPGYSYVRGSGDAGDAYYGDGGATYVAPSYYGGYYGNGYYGYGGGYYGCCYAPGVSVGVGSVWYGGSRYRHDDYRGRRDYDRHAGHWQGRSDGGHRGNGGREYHGGDRRGSQGSDSHGSGQRSHGSGGGGHGGSHGHRDRGNDRH